MAISIFKDLVKYCRESRRKKTAKTLRGNPSEYQDPDSLASNTTEHRDPASSRMNTACHQSPDHDTPEGHAQLPLADSASQNLVPSDDPQDSAQPVTQSTDLVTVSPHELDTGKGCPSRSTTGSESIRPGSANSGPSVPFPPVYEEPNSIDEASQLKTPPPGGHRLSDTSTKKNYYESGVRDRVIPKEVLCYLKLKFDGKRLSRPQHFQLDWQDDASYGTVNNAARKCLNSSPETINKKVWRTDGVCKLFKYDQECSSKALENEDQWSEVLHLIIAEFVTVPDNEYAKFHLEIIWTYAAVDDPAVEKQYSKKIADLIDARMRTNWRKKKFIPQKDLHAIMSQTVIEHLIDKDESLKSLQDLSPVDGPIFDKKKFTRDVVTKHKHLLALCVYEELPLKCLWQMLYLSTTPMRFPLNEKDIPSGAEKRKFDNLLIKQWWFTAYQFPKPTDAKVHCIDLKEDDVLPIEACDEVKPIGWGASKNVYQVQIQPGHHRFTADKTSVFALKEFKNGCAFEEFERESKVLRKLLNVPHKHITPHYASWSQLGHFFMLSPLASCNLKVYWKNKRPRLGDSDFVLWELRQLRGLADGLRYIYNLGGWHHDLKAENLLVFEEGDCGGPTLKIADFGSAKIHPRRSGPRDESSPTNSYSQGTSAYEAPDYVIRGETSRPYDVWTLGCIFMDMLVWTFGSTTSELETFSNERRVIKGGKIGTDTMFWYVEFDGRYFTTHWKPQVRKRLQGLEDLCNSDKGRAVFKELVLTTSKMLRMDPSARPKPYEVHNDMDRMTLWAEEAVKEQDWSIQTLLIGAIPSTAKSETSGESDGDGVPVRAEFGHMMLDNTSIREATFLAGRKAARRSLRDGNDLGFVGLHLSENVSNVPQLVVDGVDHTSDGTTPRLDTRTERPLLGSHGISPDRDAFAEARTAVPSAAASEIHLPPST